MHNELYIHRIALHIKAKHNLAVHAKIACWHIPCPSPFNFTSHASVHLFFFYTNHALIKSRQRMGQTLGKQQLSRPPESEGHQKGKRHFLLPICHSPGWLMEAAAHPPSVFPFLLLALSKFQQCLSPLFCSHYLVLLLCVCEGVHDPKDRQALLNPNGHMAMVARR